LMSDNLDEIILSMASIHWRKVALVIAKTLHKLEGAGHNFSEDEMTERVKALVAVGGLESQGNLDHWRYSEVRLPQSN
jgi:Protein of unknown function